MKIKAIYTKVKEYIEYRKYVFDDLRATGYITKKEIICVSVFLLFVAGFIIFWIADSWRMEKEYQRKVQELNRYYREKERELNINRSEKVMPGIDEFETLEDWFRWQLENDEFERPR